MMDVHEIEDELIQTFHEWLIHRRTHFPDDHRFQRNHFGHMDNTKHATTHIFISKRNLRETKVIFHFLNFLL